MRSTKRSAKKKTVEELNKVQLLPFTNNLMNVGEAPTNGNGNGGEDDFVGESVDD